MGNVGQKGDFCSWYTILIHNTHNFLLVVKLFKRYENGKEVKQIIFLISLQSEKMTLRWDPVGYLLQILIDTLDIDVLLTISFSNVISFKRCFGEHLRPSNHLTKCASKYFQTFRE